MANTIKGRLMFVGNIEKFTTATGKEFCRRKFVLDCTRHDPYTGERLFENTPEFELIKDRVGLVDNIPIGTVVDVDFYLDGRKFTNKTTGKEGFITTVLALSVAPAAYQPKAVTTSQQPMRQPVPQPTQAQPQQPQPQQPYQQQPYVSNTPQAPLASDNLPF